MTNFKVADNQEIKLQVWIDKETYDYYEFIVNTVADDLHQITNLVLVDRYEKS